MREGDGTERIVPNTLCYSTEPPYLELVQEVPGTVWECNEHSNLHHIGVWTDALPADSATYTELRCPLQLCGRDDDGALVQFRVPPRPARRPHRARRPRDEAHDGGVHVQGAASLSVMSRPRSRSSSSAGSARSGGTASASRSRAASWSSTAGSCSPRRTCPGSTSSSPTSPICARTPTGSKRRFLTHAHEDHAGGLAYLLRDVSMPIYGSPLSLGLARNRIEEAGMLGRTELIPVHDGERRHIGPFDCEFIPVTHSVPHALRHRVPHARGHDPAQRRLQARPDAGRRSQDRPRVIGEIAEREGGVKLLLSDSTNAERPGFTPSEKTVGDTLRSVFRDYPDQRLIVASFASHLHRVQQVAERRSPPGAGSRSSGGPWCTTSRSGARWGCSRSPATA